MSATKRKGAACATDDSPLRKKRPKELDFHENVSVVVGKDESAKRFVVPKVMITKRSPFFTAACKEEWSTPDEDRVIRLPDQTAPAFNRYLQLLYTNGMAFDPTAQPRESQTDVALRIYRELLEMYILVHFIQDLAACNSIVETWMEMWDTERLTPNPAHIALAFERLPHNCKLIELCKRQLAMFSSAHLELCIKSPCWPLEATQHLLLYCHKIGGRNRLWSIPLSTKKDRFMEVLPTEEQRTNA